MSAIIGRPVSARTTLLRWGVPGFAAVLLMFVASATARAQDADRATQARQHYEAGVGLFEAGNKEQALVEFQLANELVPKKENLFMVAQCQYHLGFLKEARASYQEFLAQTSSGELADIARLRIDAINRRPSVVVINTVPDQVQVRIEGEGQVFTGEAPNEFRVPRGRYRVSVSKPSFAGQDRDIAIDVAETKPLFFKLDPIPAHLEIRTVPGSATLFVRGNRTQNPYAQDVEPGNYEIYAEATDYLPRHDTVSLGPGQKLKVDFPLPYVQRSGRPELIGFWTGIVAVGGGMAVATRLNPKQPANLTLVFAGAVAGGIGAAVIATALVPSYIKDNRALFRIGGSWIGDAEGLSLGLALTQTLSGALLGGTAGLGLGSLAGWWLDERAPNYGRVAMIQSATFLGAIAGVLAIPAVGSALKSTDTITTGTQSCTKTTIHTDRVGWGLLAGMNIGLVAGLALAYLPDQRDYGPTWQRVMLVDLAALAGGFTGALAQICFSGRTSGGFCSDFEVGPKMARYALAGSAVGLLTGFFLTWNYDKRDDNLVQRQPTQAIPMPGALPIQTTDGHWALIPGLSAQGRF